MRQFFIGFLIVAALLVGGSVVANVAYQVGVQTAVTTVAATAPEGTVVTPVVPGAVPGYGYGYGLAPGPENRARSLRPCPHRPRLAWADAQDWAGAKGFLADARRLHHKRSGGASQVGPVREPRAARSSLLPTTDDAADVHRRGKVFPDAVNVHQSYRVGLTDPTPGPARAQNRPD